MQLKRGDTLALVGPLLCNGLPLVAADWQVYGELRDANGALTHVQPVCTWKDAATSVVQLKMQAVHTQSLNEGGYEISIRLERISDGYIITTNSGQLRLIER